MQKCFWIVFFDRTGQWFWLWTIFWNANWKICVNKVNLKVEKVSSKVIIKNCKDKRVSRFKWFLTLSPHKLSMLFPYVFEFLMTNWSFRIGSASHRKLHDMISVRFKTSPYRLVGDSLPEANFHPQRSYPLVWWVLRPKKCWAKLHEFWWGAFQYAVKNDIKGWSRPQLIFTLSFMSLYLSVIVDFVTEAYLFLY